MKKLGKILLFIFLLFVVSKLFVLFTAYQTISTIKQKYQDDFLLTYRWISSSLDGTVTFEGLEFTPYALKNTFVIEELNLHYSNYLNLLTNLGGLSEANITQLERISAPSIRAELKGRSLASLLAERIGDSWITPFNIYGCENIETLSTKEYAQMGLTLWESALDLAITPISSSKESLSISLDQNELGKISIQLEWPFNSLNSLLRTQNIAGTKLYSIMVEHQDAGLFRRLNILCNNQGADKRSIFSARSAMEWKNAMYKKGLLVNDVLVEAYGLYLLQGGTFVFSGSKEEGFELEKYTSLMNQDVMKYFTAQIQVNGKHFQNGELWADESIIYPPLVEKTTKPKSENAVNHFVPGYRLIEVEQLSTQLGKKLRIIMLNEKIYEGIAEGLTDYNVTLSQNLPGGVVQYPLMLNEIKTAEVWLNQAP